MNKLMAEAVLARATQGQRLIIVDRTMTACQAHFDDVAHTVDDATAQITRTNGRQRITLTNGGSIRFLTYRNLRGATADIAVLYNESHLTTPAQAALAPVIMRAGD